MSEQWIAMPLSALGFALQLANEERAKSLDESIIRRRPRARSPRAQQPLMTPATADARPSPTVIVDPSLYSTAEH